MLYLYIYINSRTIVLLFSMQINKVISIKSILSTDSCRVYIAISHAVDYWQTLNVILT